MTEYSVKSDLEHYAAGEGGIARRASSLRGSIEIAVTVADQPRVGECSVRPASEGMQDGLLACAVQLEDNSAASIA